MSVARGYPEAPGIPSELEVLAWLVGGFWALVAAILLALWLARRQQRRRDPLIEQRLEPPDERDLATWAGDLKASMPPPRSPERRGHGRHSAS